MIFIIVAIILIIVFVVATIILCISLTRHYDSSDSGGVQVGGSEEVSSSLKDDEKVGARGEIEVNHHLRQILRYDEYLLVNLLLPFHHGHKTEIDCVIISRKGVFCVETKNWSGRICGSDEEDIWYQHYTYKRLGIREHKNPVWQNEAHCDALEKRLYKGCPIYNVVIFKKLDKGSSIDSKYAYKLREFIDFYNSLEDNELSESQMYKVYDTLVPYVATNKQLEKHKKDLQRRFSD